MLLLISNMSLVKQFNISLSLIALTTLARVTTLTTVPAGPVPLDTLNAIVPNKEPTALVLFGLLFHFGHKLSLFHSLSQSSIWGNKHPLKLIAVS